jgi:hypothetical protein
VAAPDPEGFSVLAKVTAAAVAIIGPVWGARTWLDKRFEKKADKDDLEEAKRDIDSRKRIEEKLFDAIKDHSQRDEELFRQLAEKMGDYHADVLRALGDKADR